MVSVKLSVDDVMGDGVEPGAESPGLTVFRQRGQSLRKHLLCGILRPLHGPQAAVAIPVDPGEVASVECGERLLVVLSEHNESSVFDRGAYRLLQWTQAMKDGCHAARPACLARMPCH